MFFLCSFANSWIQWNMFVHEMKSVLHMRYWAEKNSFLNWFFSYVSYYILTSRPTRDVIRSTMPSLECVKLRFLYMSSTFFFYFGCGVYLLKVPPFIGICCFLSTPLSIVLSREENVGCFYLYTMMFLHIILECITLVA